MANFKGGFAFNNEAAKVEVEQAPDGTLISCVNPVTGEELGGGGVGEVVFEGALAFTNTTNLNDYLSPEDFAITDAYVFYVESLAVNNRSMNYQLTWTFAVLYANLYDSNHAAYFHVRDSNDDYDYDIQIVHSSPDTVNITSGALSVAGTITKIIKISA